MTDALRKLGAELKIGVGVGFFLPFADGGRAISLVKRGVQFDAIESALRIHPKS
jgi:hypothetical protein